MMINFGFKNFRSFSNISNLSMQKGKSNSLEDTLIEKEEHSFLPVKVIYGNNASGKTSIILGMQLLKEIILEGKVVSNDTKGMLFNIPIYHFIHSYQTFLSPMELWIEFLYQDNIFKYELSIENKEENNTVIPSVLFEKLYIDNIEVFTRNKNKVTFHKTEKEKIYMSHLDNDYLTKMENILENNNFNTQVFTSWFNINDELVNKVKGYFIENLNIFEGLDDINVHIEVDNNEFNNMNYYNEYVSKFLKKADFGPQEIYFKVSKQESGNYKTDIESIYYTGKDENAFRLKIPAHISESEGTLKLLNFLGPFIETILHGSTLVVDELDNSLHPEIVAGIIKAFEDKRINNLGAQLIFTTHNPVYLNKNLFREDEVLFTEKDENYVSTISNLEDYDENDEYLKNYLEGKYTILSNIDFGQIISEIKEHEV